jgi:hypothetical protein
MVSWCLGVLVVNPPLEKDRRESCARTSSPVWGRPGSPANSIFAIDKTPYSVYIYGVIHVESSSPTRQEGIPHAAKQRGTRLDVLSMLNVFLGKEVID